MGEQRSKEPKDGGVSRVGVIGASGFVGRAVSRELAGGGIEVTGFSRRPDEARVDGVVAWRNSGALDVSGLDAVANLAGEPINRRWTLREWPILLGPLFRTCVSQVLRSGLNLVASLSLSRGYSSQE